MTTSWVRDTHAANPPADHYYASALWLLGRHPQLVRLVERVPGAVTTDRDGTWLELDVIADALEALDQNRATWHDYAKRHPEPSTDHAWEAWERNGPPHTHPAAPSIGVMSRTEVSRLRLLAFFAPVEAGALSRRLTVCDLGGFDDAGRRLLHDWTLAVLAA